MTRIIAKADALLFDMDGTLIDSTPGVLATWKVYEKEHNLDLEEVLRTSHGIRTEDNLKRWCNVKPENITAETKRFEDMILAEGARLKDIGEKGLEILPGVQTLLSSIPQDKWTIVTSATAHYAKPALEIAQCPLPPKMVTANDVKMGKPHPEPYLTGADKLGKSIENCIVFEDAPSGIKSGVASGAKVLAVCTSHTREQVTGMGATWIVEDLTKVLCTVVDGQLHLEIDESQ
ncbi:hypothetical protein QFC22_004080 [Naganishia vaughanmartiniae]|uniref:Uncharacterized protein n=1 Tax=Naganishia vaughanmartiniae TaxID=1424756 RepID=A0ACC2X3F1_9TREE|nr:hypothetical protein QFC22_004080 [Naganishia vaughanmartiniae]